MGESVKHYKQQNIIALSPSDSYLEDPKAIHRKNMNSFQLNSIDEQIPTYDPPKHTIPVLTHEALREHTIQCEAGIDSSSVSTISSSGDTLKNIGDQLLSMNISNIKYKQYKSRSTGNHSRKTSLTLSETPIPSDYTPKDAAINKPKYYRIASDSNQMKMRMDVYKNEESETDTDDLMNESGDSEEGNPFGSRHHTSKSLNFPDVMSFV